MGVFSDNTITGFFLRFSFDPIVVCFLPILQVSFPSSTSLFLFAYVDLFFFFFNGGFPQMSDGLGLLVHS